MVYCFLAAARWAACSAPWGTASPKASRPTVNWNLGNWIKGDFPSFVIGLSPASVTVMGMCLVQQSRSASTLPRLWAGMLLVDHTHGHYEYIHPRQFCQPNTPQDSVLHLAWKKAHSGKWKPVLIPVRKECLRLVGAVVSQQTSMAFHLRTMQMRLCTPHRRGYSGHVQKTPPMYFNFGGLDPLIGYLWNTIY